ncbi:hypothetical protein SK128_020897 [Halocaridina rubra]|uniref:Uncharacterized protein n=1 Tax=Halocaridina rubra TaxID=373956 RepID=A0AAN9ADA5_HALRR
MNLRPRGEHLQRCWNIQTAIAATSLLVYQVWLNVADYMAKPTIFMVSLQPNDIIRLPPISVCAYPPFAPDKLRDLGLDISGNMWDVIDSLSSLKGLPADMKVSRLWNEAGWSFGQVIRDILLGETYIVYNDYTLTSAPNWYRSFSPTGPCFTFVAPSHETAVRIQLMDIPHVEPCRVQDQDKQFAGYISGVTSCEAVQELCNSSCGFEDYLEADRHNYDRAFVYFHDLASIEVPVSDSEEDIIAFSERLFKGKFTFRELIEIPSIRSHVQLIEKSMLTESCISDENYNIGECYFHNHRLAIENTLACTPVETKFFDYSLNDTCSHPDQILRIHQLIDRQSTEKNCSSKCYSKAWDHDISETWHANFAVSLALSSNDTRKEEELETYPLSQLMSNIGGSLGFFLGVSVFTGWEYIMAFVQYLPHTKAVFTSYHFRRVINSVVMAFLFVVSGVHCLVVLKFYILQPQLTSVKVAANPSNDSPVEDVLIRRLASRSLGCRQREVSYDEKLSNCILSNALNEIPSVAPFINLEDLPFCDANNRSQYIYEFIVPPEMVVAATMTKRLIACKEQVSETEGLQGHNISLAKNMIINYEFYSMDPMLLFCSLGGIIGLYLGVSVFDGIDLIGSLHSPNLQGPRNYCYLTTKVAKITLLVLSLALIIFMLVRFIFYHPFSTTMTSGTTHTETNPLVLTLCRWPPLSPQYLSQSLDLNTSKSFLRNLPQTERLPRIKEELELLNGPWDTSLDDIWEKASWRSSDIINVYVAFLENGHMFWGDCEYDKELCQERWSPVKTMLNRCISFNTTGLNNTLTKIILSFPDELDGQRIYGVAPQIYFTVSHSRNPPLLSQLVPKMPYQRIIATVNTVTYENKLYGDHTTPETTTTYPSCVTNCIHQIFFSTYNCILPYMSQSLPRGNMCNQTIYSEIHRYFKGLDVIGAGWDDFENLDNASLSLYHRLKGCYTSCRHLHDHFYEMTIERVPDRFPTIEINFPSDSLVTVKEVESYSLAQFISDFDDNTITSVIPFVFSSYSQSVVRSD